MTIQEQQLEWLRQTGSGRRRGIPAGQIPADRPSREALMKLHEDHLATHAGFSQGPRPVKQVPVEEAYRPSTCRLDELSSIALCDLQLETHHRGRRLVVQTVTAPFCGVGAVSVVVDADGTADKLALYNQSDTTVLSQLPRGFVVAIKEPFYKYNGPGDYMVCVDHPCDVVLLRFGDATIPKQLQPIDDTLTSKSSETWRDAGDASFLQRDYPTAVFCYTEAIKKSDEGTFRSGVLTKRARIHMLLEKYDAARSDALASQRKPFSDGRALITAAKASYALRDYKESKRLYEKAAALEKSPPASIQRELSRCQQRLREEETGEKAFDFPAMLASLSYQHVHLDCSSYLRRTVVKQSPFHGQGLFASEDIRAGEIVFVEKAAFMPNQYEPDRASVALFAMITRQIYDNPSMAARIVDLYGGELSRLNEEGQVLEPEADQNGGGPYAPVVLDVFRAEQIRIKNCFSTPLSTWEDTKPHSNTRGRLAKGLWRQAAHLNHSCVPNTMRSFLGDIFISRAVCDIAAGDELMQQYVPIRADRQARLDELRNGWGFDCGCPLCSAEGQDEPAIHEQRQHVLRAVEKTTAKHPPESLPPEAAMRTVAKLLTLVYPTMWLLRAHRRRRQHAKVVLYATKLLGCFGFAAPTVDAGRGAAAIFAAPDDIRLHTIHVVSALKYGSEAHRALGATSLADAWEAAGRFGYRIITGFDSDLDAIDQGEVQW